MDISSYSVDYYHHVVAEMDCTVLTLLLFIIIILPYYPFIIYTRRQDIVYVQVKEDKSATACLKETI